MPRPISRRDFLSRAVVAASVLATPRVRWRTVPARAPLRIAVIPSARTPDRALGIQLGVDEARHAATLFGGGVDVTVAAPNESLERAAPRLLAARPAVVLGGDTRAECDHLAELAQAHASLYFNVGCDDDGLRGAQCRRAAFHVCPSAAMLRQAVSETRAGGATAEAWDPALVKFGADTLNERFQKQFHRPMGAPSWCGWVAIKIAWEASLRARAVDGPSIGAFLETSSAQFDGHKGRALSFRPWDHQLRQPVYVTQARAAGAEPIEVPSSRAEEDARTSLDRLGTTRAASICVWKT